MPQPRPAADTRKPYQGQARALVIAIDIGTTFSGVSYAVLEPGEIPKITGVTRFPGQEHVGGNTKIPSVIYYDRHGKLMAAGAEADTSGVQAQAEEEGWIRAELFKLRLRPRTMQLNMNGMRFGPLPKRKTAVHVFGDFLAYLYRCTRTFIIDTHANGGVLWNQVESNIQFVLSHPNGWEGAQQSKMRRAAIYGGLIPETNEGKARIKFVTEGEASLHACVLNGLASDVLSNPSKHGFLIADAGGGTLDISAYAIKGTSPLVIEEIAPPDCIFAGSVFVSRRARGFLEVKLRDSRYGDPDTLDHITRRFDETTKRLFSKEQDLQFVPFGSPLDKDPSVGIRGGQLKLTGQEVANFFEPSVDAAFNAIKAQLETSQGLIKSVFLVGGYAASPWLFGQLQKRLEPYKVSVSRPDTHTSKAVADGAIGFFCDHHVSARVSKFMYGVEFLREMDPRDPDHVARKERLCELPSGPKLLPDAFDCILSRGVKVKESTVFTRKYCTELTSLSMLSVFEVEIWCYRGGNTIPMWINRQADNFSTLCVVRADLSPLASSAEPKVGRNGKTYWTIVFSVEIQFGLTEFKARIKWVESGMTKHGPASIIYNERGHRADEDEPDVFPEDEANTAAATTPTPRSANRSEPVSRSRTPIVDRQPSIPPSVVSSRRPSQSYPQSELSYASGTGIPEVARVERDRSISRTHSHQASPSISSRNGIVMPNGGEYESDRRSSTSKGKEKDRDRELRSDRMDTPRATPRSTKIGETLSAVWGAGGPQSNAASPKHSAAPSPTVRATEPPVGSTTRGSSVYGDRPKSPWVDAPAQQQQIHQPQTPSHQSTRSIHSQQKSPWVETISTTIEPPKTHSPWDSVPNSIQRSISNASVASHIQSPAEKERMSSLWEDAPRSSYGEPPKTPWNSKTPSHGTRPLANDETTVLLATTPGGAGVPVDLPRPESLSRSLSVSGKSVHSGVPLDADDAPSPGGDVTSGWGGITPRSINATPAAASVGGAGSPWGIQGVGVSDMMTPVPPAAAASALATPAVSTPGSKIPKRSRKNSAATTGLSSSKLASPAKLVTGAFGGEETASPNLLAEVPAGIGGFGRHSGHISPNKQPLSPLNPAAQSSWTDPQPVETYDDGGGGNIGGGGEFATGGEFDWMTTGGEGGHSVENHNWDLGVGENTRIPTTGTDTWNFNDTSQPAPAENNDTWAFDATSPTNHHPVVPPIETQIQTQTPKTPGSKTPKSAGSKTPKTPAAEVSKKVAKTPVIEPVVPSPVVEVSTPTTPTATTTKKKKTTTKKGSAAAAAAAAEEEERKRQKEAEEEAERERERERERELVRQAEEEEQARLAKEAADAEIARIAWEAEEAERQRIATEAAEAEAKRLAQEEEDRRLKEEEDRLNAELEAEEAKLRAEKEKEEKERKDKEAKAAAAALSKSPTTTTTRGGKGKKNKKGAPLNLWEDEEEKEKERLAQEQREAEDRAAREKADQEAKAREVEEKAEAEARARKAEEEARELAEAEARKAEAEKLAEAERLAEESRKADEAAKLQAEREAEEKAEQDAQGFGPARGKKGKKGKGKTSPWGAFAGEEENAKAEQEDWDRIERENAEKQNADREEKEKAERERKEKEELEAKVEQDAQEFAPVKGKKGKKTKAKDNPLESWPGVEENAKAEEERLKAEQEEREKEEREKAEKEERERGERERTEREWEERERAERDAEERERAERENREKEAEFAEKQKEATADAGGQDGGGSGSIFGFGGGGNRGSLSGSTGGWSFGFGSKKPSLTNALGSTWGTNSTFGTNFGSFGFGESEPQQEEVKLVDVPAKPTNKSGSLFDSWGLSPDPASGSAVDLLGSHEAPKDLPPVPPQSMSRGQSPTLSPAPAPIPPPGDNNLIISHTEPENEHNAEHPVDTTPDPTAEAPTEEVAAPETLAEEVQTANAEDEFEPAKTKKKKKVKVVGDDNAEGGTETKKKKKKGK